MATSTISNIITGPSGTALAAVPVVIRLVPRGAFRIDTGTEVAAEVRTTTNASGLWSVALERNSNISPTNSYYEVEERCSAAQGGPRKYTFQVGATNQTLFAALVSPIPDITSSNYMTQASADARYLQGPLSSAAASDSRPNDTVSGSGTAVAYANHVHDRETTYGTAATRAALSGTDLFSGLRYRETDTGKLYEYRAAAWLQRADHFIVADAAARTAITTPYEGMMVRQADTDTLYEYSGSAWEAVLIEGAWTSYTPTWTQVGTISKTIQYAKYAKVGRTVHVKMWLQATSAGTGNNAIIITVPLTAANTTLEEVCGAGSFQDTGTATYPFVVRLSGGNFRFARSDQGPTNHLGIDPNFAIANTDEILFYATYEAAA